MKYMKKQDRIKSLMSGDNAPVLTSHSMAKYAGCTPSYARTICKKLFKEGKVGYYDDPHQGNSGFARCYTSIERARHVNRVFGIEKFKMPDAIQEKLSL